MGAAGLDESSQFTCQTLIESLSVGSLKHVAVFSLFPLKVVLQSRTRGEVEAEEKKVEVLG